MKLTKRLFSAILCTAILFSNCPSSVLAHESSKNNQKQNDDSSQLTLKKELGSYDKQTGSFDMNLHISGDEVKNKSDIVLVVDCSGSMGKGKIDYTETTRKVVYKCNICGREFDSYVDEHDAFGYTKVERMNYIHLKPEIISEHFTGYYYLSGGKYYPVYGKFSLLEDDFRIYYKTENGNNIDIKHVGIRNLLSMIDFDLYTQSNSPCNGQLEKKIVYTTENKQGNKKDALKAAAKQFIYNTLDNENASNTRLAIVTYSDDCKLQSNFTSDINDLEAAVDEFYSYGGTHIQSGIKKARDLLSRSNANRRYAIILSDGKPTYSYDYYSASGSYEELYGNRLYENMSFDYSDRVGDGSSFYYDYGFYYRNHGVPTIYEARQISKLPCAENQKKPIVYSIAFGTSSDINDTFNDVMKRCATDEAKFYKAGQNINDIFSDIAGKVSFAAENSVIVDPMGEAFALYDANNDGKLDIDDITVKIGNKTLLKAEKEQNVDIRYYNNGSIVNESRKVVEISADGKSFTVNGFQVMKDQDINISYKIRIKDGFIPETNGAFPTNGKTIIYYDDSEGNLKSEEFEVPSVDLYAAKIKVKAVRSTEDGNGYVTDDGRETGNIDDAQILDEYDWTENNVSRFLIHSGLSVSKTVSAPTRTNEVFNGIEFGDESLSDNSVAVALDKDNLSPTVYLKYFIPENGTKLTISKVGCEDCDADQSFIFTVTSMDGKEKYTVRTYGNEKVTITGLKYGEYTITENTDWSWRYTPDGEKHCTISADNPTTTVVITNNRTNKSWLSGDDSCVNQFAREAVE